MNTQFTRAPHQAQTGQTIAPAGPGPNAALLIDFDNVTMGVRSDLSKELKVLLDSDIIKGKVAVQRAYADWRRYPQYIVPLSEASIDLIFAPAYGSTKKNATDIRLAIDACELVFTRPEIGTYILLSGDSDFSSLVLKLKEYGKYVIGVGMRESRSDLLVQNCDEYYSYSGITGLTRAGTETSRPSENPWELVERAIRKMVDRKDVMRSDRLKQVLLELDPSFSEKSLGYSKFNRFVSEAASRNRLRLKGKLDNGQYELAPSASKRDGGSGRSGSSKQSGSESSGGRRRGGSRRGRSDRGRRSRPRGSRSESQADSAELEPAFDLLRRAVADLTGGGGDDAVRDSEVKRRLLDLEPDWSEQDFGMSKFSQFLRRAHNEDVVRVRKGDNGNYSVALPADSRGAAAAAAHSAAADESETEASAGAADARTQSDGADSAAEGADRPSRSLRGRRGTRRKGMRSGPPPLLDGQTVSSGSKSPASSESARAGADRGAASREEAVDDGRGRAFASELGLPTGPATVARYLANSYKGVGKKTAEALIEAFSAENVFYALHERTDHVRQVLGDGRRTQNMLDAWQADYDRRRESGTEESGSADGAHSEPGESETVPEAPDPSRSREPSPSEQPSASRESSTSDPWSEREEPVTGSGESTTDDSDDEDASESESLVSRLNPFGRTGRRGGQSGSKEKAPAGGD